MRNDIFTEPLLDFGDLFTINKWRDCVKYGGFVDSDGCGNFVKNGKMTSSFQDNVCSLDEIDKMQKMGATHIIWFNK